MEKKESSSEYEDEDGEDEEEKETSASTAVPVCAWRKKKKTKRVVIDISEASTAQALMEEVIKANPDKYKKTLDKEKNNIRYVYCNAADEDLIDILSKKGRTINRYPGIKGLSHKDSFTRFMSVCLDLNSEAYGFVPPQF